MRPWRGHLVPSISHRTTRLLLYAAIAHETENASSWQKALLTGYHSVVQCENDLNIENGRSDVTLRGRLVAASRRAEGITLQVIGRTYGSGWTGGCW